MKIECDEAGAAAMVWLFPLHGRFYFGTGDSYQIGVYSTEGELQRLIRVYEIAGDYVLGSWRDEYDVEYAQLYDLLKPGSEMVGR